MCYFFLGFIPQPIQSFPNHISNHPSVTVRHPFICRIHPLMWEERKEEKRRGHGRQVGRMWQRRREEGRKGEERRRHKRAGRKSMAKKRRRLVPEADGERRGPSNKVTGPGRVEIAGDPRTCLHYSPIASNCSYLHSSPVLLLQSAEDGVSAWIACWGWECGLCVWMCVGCVWWEKPVLSPSLSLSWEGVFGMNQGRWGGRWGGGASCCWIINCIWMHYWRALNCKHL